MVKFRSLTSYCLLSEGEDSQQPVTLSFTAVGNSSFRLFTVHKNQTFKLIMLTCLDVFVLAH